MIRGAFGVTARGVVTLVLASLASGLAAPPALGGVEPPSLDWARCADQPNYQCAFARVPLDYRTPHGAQIRLALIRHRATNPSRRIGTLFFNPGGPGDALPQFPTVYENYLPRALTARFDVVTWDLRGLGSSTNVQCFNSEEAEDEFLSDVGTPSALFPFGTAEIDRWIETYARFGTLCGERNPRALLRNTSTVNSARDMDLLRRAVGSPTLNYIGISYGTFLGATYANMFPHRIRALVHDGVVYPPAWVNVAAFTGGNRFLGTWLRNRGDIGAAKTLRAYLDLCGRASTARCAFSAGTATATRRKWDTLLRRLKVRPVGEMTYAKVVSDTVQALYFIQAWERYAQVLQRIWTQSSASSSATPAWSPTRRPLPTSAAAAGSMTRYSGPEGPLSIICGESPNPPANAFRALDRFAFNRSGDVGRYWNWASEPCGSWPARAATRYTGPWNRYTASPVLVMGTTHDPATPYENAIDTARLLARARLLRVDGYGHTSLTNPSTCANRLVTRYFVNRTLPRPGARCRQNFTPFSN